MPIIKSARKRVRQAARAKARNTRTKRTLREAVKAFTQALTSGKPEEIAKAEKEAMSAIDTAAKKSVIHKNKAARKKAQLAAQAKSAGAQKTKTAAKKAAPKAKTAPKKAAPKAKKSAAKK